MNRMTKKFYAMNRGWLCPFCLGQELETVPDHCVFLEEHRRCLDCGKVWIEQHKIVGYIEVKQPAKEEDE